MTDVDLPSLGIELPPGYSLQTAAARPDMYETLFDPEHPNELSMAPIHHINTCFRKLLVLIDGHPVVLVLPADSYPQRCGEPIRIRGGLWQLHSSILPTLL